jgi:DNA-binding NarL/FixJ family response regulator
MIRVLVADDFPMIREALVAALERHPGISVVGTAEDGEQALEIARAQRPDVVVLDVRMPGMSGMTVLAHLAQELPDVRVLVLTAAVDREVVIDAVSTGASGFLAKRVSGDELAEAVTAIHGGEVVIAPSLMAHLVSGLCRSGDHEPAPPDVGSLTETEREVLRRVAAGRTDREISAELFICSRTIQSHLSRIRAKLGVSRRAELTRWAVEHQVV